MTVRVQFWSYFRERTGTASAVLELPAGATVSAALAEVYHRWPVLEPLSRSTLVAVGVDYAEPDRVLTEGEELSLFPPVQGG